MDLIEHMGLFFHKFSKFKVHHKLRNVLDIGTYRCCKYGLFAVHTAFKNMYFDGIHVCHSKFTVYG